jgi:chromosome segregation ATPase
MNHIIQESNPLIEQLDVLGDLLQDTEASGVKSVQDDQAPLSAYLDSVKHAMEKFQQRATELSSNCAETEIGIKKGLSRITYGLFSLGIAMSIVANMLLISAGGSLLQLAMCNFGTMIIFVLAGVCLLNDITNRDSQDGSQFANIHHHTQSISDNVDQLSRLTFNWNQKLQELEKKKQQTESAIQSLESQEQELSARIESRESELEQLQNDFQNQQTANLALKAEIQNLETENSTLVQSAKDINQEKDTVEQAVSELKIELETIVSKKANSESELLAKRSEIDGYEIYSQQVQGEIINIQKEISELELISEGLSVGIEERKSLLEITQNKIDSLLKQEQELNARVFEIELRLDEVCACEVRHRDLTSIQDSIENSLKLVAETTHKIESLERSRTELELAITELETTERTLAIGVDLLRMEFQEQSNLVDQKTEYLDSLSDHEMRLQKQVDELVDRLASHELQETMQSDIGECELLLATKREEMIALQAQTESLRNEIYFLGREASELQAFVEKNEVQAFEEMSMLLESHDRAVEEKQHSINDLTAQVKTLVAREMEARSKLQVVEDELVSARNQVSSAELTAVAIEEAIAEAQTKLTAMEMEQNRKEGQAVLLENQIDLKLGELDGIEKSIEEAKEREEALKALCDDADNRIAVLAEKSECLADHLGTMMGNLEELEQQREKAKLALDELDRLVLERAGRAELLGAEIVDRESKIAELQSTCVAQDELRLVKAKELNQIETEIVQSKESLESLRIALKEIQEQRDIVSHEVQEHKSELEKVLARKEDEIGESQRIHASIQLGKVKLEENERALKHSLNEVLAAETKLAKTTESQCLLQAESYQFGLAINAAKAKLVTIEAEIASADRQREDLTLEAKQIQQECDELSNAKNALEGLHKNIQLQIAADRQELAECESDIARAEDLRQEIVKLQSNADQISRHSQSLVEKVGLLEHECEAKEAELDRTVSELKRFESLMAKSEKAFSDVNQKCEIAQSQLIELEGRKASTRKELDQLEHNCSKNKLAAEAIAHELMTIERSRNQAQIDLQRFSAEVTEAQTVCRQWQEYGEMLKRTNQELDLSQKSLERQVQTLNVEQKNAEYALQQNVLAVKNAASQRDKINTEIETLEGKRRDLVHSEDAIKHSLESKRALLNELDTELDRSRMNIDNATLEFEQLRLKCKTEKNQLTELTSQHDELLREISNRSELHEQQTRRCDDLKSQEQALVMKLAQVKEKIQVFQEQEKIYSEKRAQWEALDAGYSKKSIEMDNLLQSISIHREQLASVTKELTDCQSQLGVNQVALEEVLGKLNQGKVQFATESGRQKSLLADLSSDLQAKQITLQQTNAALQSTNDRLVRAEDEFASWSERLSGAQERLALVESKNRTTLEAKIEIEKSITELSDTCHQLEARRVEVLAEIAAIEQQRDVVQAENFDFVQSHLTLKATEATLVQGCQLLEEELQAKRDQLAQTVMQIGAGEQQVFETLQAITLIGQQREGAVARLELDRERLEQVRTELESLQIQKLDCESSVLHFQSEVARMAASRERFAEELRALELRRHDALEAALSQQVAVELIAEKEETVISQPDESLIVGVTPQIDTELMKPEPMMLATSIDSAETRQIALAPSDDDSGETPLFTSQPETMVDELEMLANEFAKGNVLYGEEVAEYRSAEISLEENVLGELESVVKSIDELNIRDRVKRDECIEDDAWGDLLRVVRVA